MDLNCRKHYSGIYNMVRYNNKKKEYNSTGAINRDYDTRDFGIDQDSESSNNLSLKREEIKNKIQEKEKLIRLTKAFIDTPKSEGGLSREDGIKKVALFEEDIRNLENELEDILKEEIKPLELTTTSEPEPEIHKPQPEIPKINLEPEPETYKQKPLPAKVDGSKIKIPKINFPKNRYFKPGLRWNWNETFRGIIPFIVLLLVFILFYQNVDKINNTFIPSIPVGLISLVIIGILLAHHIYKVFKWYLIWVTSTKRFEKVIIHFCLYLIVISIVFSFPSSLGPVINQIQSKEIPDISGQINPSIFSFDKDTRVKINDPYNRYTQRIQDMLNTTDKSILKYIESVNVIYDESSIKNLCNYDAWGCAINKYSNGLISSPLIKSDIYVISGDHYTPKVKSGSFIKLCGSFDYTLYHEIGHVVYAIENGYQSKLTEVEEKFADSYADKFRVKEIC